MITASLVFWIPGIVVNCTYYLCSKCIPLLVLHILNLFHLANSLVNPIIYSFWIPMFRETFKRMKLCKQSKEYIVPIIHPESDRRLQREKKTYGAAFCASLAFLAGSFNNTSCNGKSDLPAFPHCRYWRTFPTLNVEWMTLYFNRVHNYSQDCSLPYGPMKLRYNISNYRH